MRNAFQSLLFLLARVSNPKLARLVEELLRQIQFLKVENKTLRERLPERIVVTPQERRRLLRFGKPLGSAIKDLITIVSPGARRFACVASDQVKIWDLSTSREVLSLRGHNGLVVSLTYLGTSGRLASGSRDGMIKIWDGTPAAEVMLRREP